MSKPLTYTFVVTFIILAIGCSKINPVLIQLPEELNETSGIVHVGNGVYITHNDSGNIDELVFITSSGKILRRVDLELGNEDFEEVKYSKNRVLVADIGNNQSDRKDLNFKYFSVDGEFLKSICFDYSKQVDFLPDTLAFFDAEAFVELNGYLVMFSKNRNSYHTWVYNIDTMLSEQSIQPFDTLATNYLVTGSCLDESNDVIYLVGYDFDRKHFLSKVRIVNSLDLKLIQTTYLSMFDGMQIEGIEFVNDTIVLTTEAENKRDKPKLIKLKL